MKPNPPLPGEDSLIAEKVRRERLHLLFRQSFFATTGALLSALMLSWLHWETGEQRTIVIWLALMGAATLLRYVVFVAHFRQGADALGPARWERIYWLTLVCSAGIWGGGALWIMESGSLLSQAISLVFTVGMAGSAVSSYSAYRSMTLAAIGLVLLPSALWMIAQPSLTQRILGFAALVFMAAAVRSTRVLSDALETSLRLKHEMESAHGAASRAAATDELTGLSNRRAFFERAEQLFSLARRNRQAVCVMVMDIDHFKAINDTRGHHAGDEVLRQLGLLLAGQFRDADVCARLGGEEFAIFLVGATDRAALEVAGKLRAAVEALDLSQCGPAPLRISASIGLATQRVESDDLRALLQQADQAMYQAKAQGRNRVVVAGKAAAPAGVHAQS